MKYIFVFFLVSFIGCAPKSEVVDFVEPISLKQSHGDGKYTILTVKLPLSDDSIASYDSPIDPATGVARIPLLGDMLRFMAQATFNFGAGLGLGKTNMTIKQPLPDLNSQYVHSISIKRVFFHIDQKKIERDVRLSLFERIRNFIRGSTALNFDFIRSLKVHMRSSQEEEPTSYMPEILTDTELTPVTNEPSNVIEFLNYQRRSRANVLNENVAVHTIVVYANQPIRLRRFIRQHPELASHVKNIDVINKSLVIELKEDIPQIGKAQPEENFGMDDAYKGKVKEFTALFDKEFGEDPQFNIYKVIPCSTLTCMDLKVNNQNLLPLIQKGNRLNIETMIDASRVPPRSFQLRGFIEFEVKLDVPI